MQILYDVHGRRHKLEHTKFFQDKRPMDNKLPTLVFMGMETTISKQGKIGTRSKEKKGTT